jgi:hypothetical protein
LSSSDVDDAAVTDEPTDQARPCSRRFVEFLPNEDCMIPESIPTPTPSTHASRRKLVVAIVIAPLMTFAAVVGDLARGGRPDPPTLRTAATLLDGAWRFRTGDVPQWADPGTDDSDWETIDMTAPPGSHDGDVGLPDYVAGWPAGHAGYHGYAWYRRTVTVPVEPASWDILGPTLVEDGYELYWNGHLLGGSGRLGAAPRVVGTRPLRFALPADAAGAHGVLAVRTFMLPRSAPSATGGGMHSAPILAPRAIAAALHRVQWERTVAGYIVDAIEPLAMLAVIGLALGFRSRSSRSGFLLFASIALTFMAARRLNNALVSWTDVMDLRTYSWMASWMWVPTVAFWTLAWNRWCLRPRRSIDVLAVVLAVAGVVGAATHVVSVTTGSRLAAVMLLVVTAVRIFREGSMRPLALITLAALMAALFGGELLDPIGVPGIWFPFGIGVSRTQYIYAIVVPLLALLIVQTIQLKGATSPEPDTA